MRTQAADPQGRVRPHNSRRRTVQAEWSHGVFLPTRPTPREIIRIHRGWAPLTRSRKIGEQPSQTKQQLSTTNNCRQFVPLTSYPLRKQSAITIDASCGDEVVFCASSSQRLPLETAQVHENQCEEEVGLTSCLHAMLKASTDPRSKPDGPQPVVRVVVPAKPRSVTVCRRSSRPTLTGQYVDYKRVSPVQRTQLHRNTHLAFRRSSHL